MLHPRSRSLCSVFFKQIRSKTKFWQMIGRGTRLCADLFGPGQDKEFFRIFDYCQHLEYFVANPETKEASSAKSLSERLFAVRLDLVRALDDKHAKIGGFSAGARVVFEVGAGAAPPSEEEISNDALRTLQDIVGSLNLQNFLVRQHRRAVEKYEEPKAWQAINEGTRSELLDEIAPLPARRGFGTEEAKRLDLLMFSLKLALLKGSKRFDALKKQLLEIASALQDQTGIPAIAHQAVLLVEIQIDQWWEGVTVPLLELVRLRVRELVQHIEKSRKAVVYSNFADEIGDGVEHILPQVGEADFARLKAKARHFLKAHQDHLVLHKLRQGKPLTPTDLGDLEKMLLDAGIGEADDIACRSAFKFDPVSASNFGSDAISMQYTAFMKHRSIVPARDLFLRDRPFDASPS